MIKVLVSLFIVLGVASVTFGDQVCLWQEILSFLISQAHFNAGSANITGSFTDGGVDCGDWTTDTLDNKHRVVYAVLSCDPAGPRALAPYVKMMYSSVQEQVCE